MKAIQFALAAAIGLTGAAAAAKAADCDITIGVVMSLTGPAGAYGQAGAKAVEMAFRDINDAGGVNGDMACPKADVDAPTTMIVAAP